MNDLFKKLFYFLSLFLAFNFTTVHADVLSSNNPEDIAKNKIKQISIDIEECPWNENSVIKNKIPLYDLNGNVNSYIYEIATNEIGQGFIQVDLLTTPYVVSRFSFSGEHILNSMIKEFETSNTNIESYKLDKVIYLGGYTYLVKDDKISYYDLNSITKLTQTKNELELMYDIYISQLKNIQSQEEQTIQPLAYPVTKYVTGADWKFLVEMDDFKDKYINGVKVDNHCSATAATNIVKYWAQKRNQPKLYNESDWWVFSSLYVNMKTNENIWNEGTWLRQAYDGLIKYSENTRGVATSGGQYILAATWAKAHQLINSDVPFVLGTKNYNGLEGFHSVAVFGYYYTGPYTSNNYLIINNGHNKTWTFEHYDSLSTLDMWYARWD